MFLAFAGQAHGATLINDPAHPFSAQDFANAQGWLAAASWREPMVPGAIVLSHQSCDYVGPNIDGHGSEGAWGCALDHKIDMYLTVIATITVPKT
jgi:hypothetical protein